MASGDAKRPLYILSVSGAVNVVLNLILIIFFGMEEAGVAIATPVSQIVSSFLVLCIMLKRDNDMKVDLRKLKFHKDELANIIRIGIPSGLNAILFNVVVNFYVDSLFAVQEKISRQRKSRNLTECIEAV